MNDFHTLANNYFTTNQLEIDSFINRSSLSNPTWILASWIISQVEYTGKLSERVKETPQLNNDVFILAGIYLGSVAKKNKTLG